MSIESIVFTLIGLFFTIGSFYIGRVSAAKNEGKNEGATLAGMAKDIQYISEEVKSIRETLDKRDTKYDDSIRRLHDKFDEHILKYHSQGADHG